MNKYEKAFEVVDILIGEEYPMYLKYHFKDGSEMSYENSINVIRELVERATPKKAKKINGIQGVYYDCPICGNQVIKNHCCDNNKCRQALDWSE